ncbi:hypothetical protein JCM15415_21840 [Methanobacterium movens]
MYFWNEYIKYCFNINLHPVELLFNYLESTNNVRSFYLWYLEHYNLFIENDLNEYLDHMYHFLDCEPLEKEFKLIMDAINDLKKYVFKVDPDLRGRGGNTGLYLDVDYLENLINNLLWDQPENTREYLFNLIKDELDKLINCLTLNVCDKVNDLLSDPDNDIKSIIVESDINNCVILNIYGKIGTYVC